MKKHRRTQGQPCAAEERGGMPTGRMAVTALAVTLHKTPRPGKSALGWQTFFAERLTAPEVQSTDSGLSFIPTRSITPFTLSRCTSRKVLLTYNSAANPAFMVLAGALSTRPLRCGVYAAADSRRIPRPSQYYWAKIWLEYSKQLPVRNELGTS